MNKFAILDRVKEIYKSKGNIIKYLKSIDGREQNSLEDILISYDFQAGAYTRGYDSNPTLRDNLSFHLASVFNKLGEFSSFLEAGVGEATILGLTVPKLKQRPTHFYGFDLSWSRIQAAKAFLERMDVEGINLFVGDMFNAPIGDNSIDVVYTVHAIEPNGGREEEALKELYRIAKKYIVMVEPATEYASDEAKKRMEDHGYVTGLYETAVQLGYEIIEHRPFEVNYNPLNPTGLIVIKKNGDLEEGNAMCCPITKSPLIENEDCFFAPDSLLAYPILNKIPCLLPQNAIVATKYQA